MPLELPEPVPTSYEGASDRYPFRELGGFDLPPPGLLTAPDLLSVVNLRQSRAPSREPSPQALSTLLWHTAKFTRIWIGTDGREHVYSKMPSPGAMGAVCIGLVWPSSSSNLQIYD